MGACVCKTWNGAARRLRGLGQRGDPAQERIRALVQPRDQFAPDRMGGVEVAERANHLVQRGMDQQRIRQRLMRERGHPASKGYLYRDVRLWIQPFHPHSLSVFGGAGRSITTTRRCAGGMAARWCSMMPAQSRRINRRRIP
jgi:hypothetical protein